MIRARTFSCPTCGDENGMIKDSRFEGTHRRRQYKCANGHSFSTWELLVPPKPARERE